MLDRGNIKQFTPLNLFPIDIATMANHFLGCISLQQSCTSICKSRAFHSVETIKLFHVNTHAHIHKKISRNDHIHLRIQHRLHSSQHKHLDKSRQPMVSGLIISNCDNQDMFTEQPLSNKLSQTVASYQLFLFISAALTAYSWINLLLA